MRDARRTTRRWFYTALTLAGVFIVALSVTLDYGGKGLFYVGVMLFAALALLCVLLAMFRDRSRGRRRCPKCWYDMSATEGLRCPECGRTAKREKQLFRTRRRWRLALLGILPALMTAYLGVQPKVQRDGWASIVPTTGLILCIRVPSNTWALDELDSRMTSAHPFADGFVVHHAESFPAWQWRLISSASIRRIQTATSLEEKVRYINLMCLSHMVLQDEPAGDHIRQALQTHASDPEPFIRSLVAHGLVRPSDPDGSLVRLMPLLTDADPTARQGALWALSSMATTSERALAQLMQGIDDPDVTTRKIVLRLLAQLTWLDGLPASVTDCFRRAAKDDDASVRQTAVSMFARALPPDEAAVEISAALGHEDPAHRSGAIWGMFELDGHSQLEGLLPILIQSLADVDDEVRDDARIVIDGLRYERFLPHRARFEELLERSLSPETEAFVRRVLEQLHRLASEEE